MWCKNRGLSIGESCEEEEDGLSGVEALVEPFVFAIEAIVGKRRKISQERKTDWFSWEKLRKKTELKEMQNLRNIWEFALIPYHQMNERKTVFSLIRKTEYKSVYIYIYTSNEPSNYLTTEIEVTNLKPIFTRVVTNSLTCHHLSKTIHLLNHKSYMTIFRLLKTTIGLT